MAYYSHHELCKRKEHFNDRIVQHLRDEGHQTSRFCSQMTVDGERLVCNVMVTNGYKNQKSFTQFRVVVKGATSGRKSFNFAVEDYNKAETVTKAALLVRNAMAEKAVAS